MDGLEYNSSMHIETGGLRAFTERLYPLPVYVHRFESRGRYALFISHAASDFSVHAYFQADFHIDSALAEEDVTHSDVLLTREKDQTELVARVMLKNGSQYIYTFMGNAREKQEQLEVDTIDDPTTTYKLSDGGHPWTYGDNEPLRAYLRLYLGVIEEQMHDLLPQDINPLLSPLFIQDQFPRPQTPTAATISWKI